MSLITSKPWGHEELWAKTEHYAAKRLFIKKGHKLSLQYHLKKEETVTVLKGILYMQINTDITPLVAGETMHIPPGTIHRMIAKDEDVELMEVSTPELDDVVRLEDVYGRV